MVGFRWLGTARNDQSAGHFSASDYTSSDGPMFSVPHEAEEAPGAGADHRAGGGHLLRGPPQRLLQARPGLDVAGG